MVLPITIGHFTHNFSLGFVKFLFSRAICYGPFCVFLWAKPQQSCRFRNMTPYRRRHTTDPSGAATPRRRHATGAGRSIHRCRRGIFYCLARYFLLFHFSFYCNIMYLYNWLSITSDNYYIGRNTWITKLKSRKSISIIRPSL